MKKLIKSITITIFSILICLSPSIKANAQWIQNPDNTWSNDSASNGWLNDNGNWYYFKNNIMQTGWVQDNEKWYYLNNNGTMVVNTSINGYMLDNNGVLINSGANNDMIINSSSYNNSKINPSKDSITDKNNKMTIFYYKDTGVIKHISSQVLDGSAIGDSNNEKYNYIIVDYNSDVESNAEDYYIQNGEIIRK
jgi:hypothetical protein